MMMMSQTASVRITAGDHTVLKSVNKFCYLGSFLSNTISADSDIVSRLAKAGCAFGSVASCTCQTVKENMKNVE